MRTPRFRLALLALLAAIATACSTTTPPSTPTTPAKANATVYPLTITQPDGTTAVIKQRPTRVLMVDIPVFAGEELVALGVTPIGGETNPPASTFGAGQYDPRGIPLSISDRLKDFTPTGTYSAPDLEAIVGLHPDLIVGYSGTKTANFQQLQAIAPVANTALQVAPPASATGIERLSWYPAMRELAKILDRQQQFNDFVSKFEAAAATARPILNGKTATIVVPANNLSQAQVYGPDYYGGVTLSYLGLTVPPIPSGGAPIKDSNGSAVNLSLERASELTAQYLLLAAFSPGVSDGFVSNPVVTQLDSVREGRVILTGSDTPVHGFPSTGPLTQLKAIPMLVQAIENAGSPH